MGAHRLRLVVPLDLVLSLSLRACALAALAALAGPASGQAGPYGGLSGSALRAALRHDYAPARTLGYGPARDSLYGYEQRTHGAVCGLYTGFCVQLTPGSDPSADAFIRGINAEHTWPQSRGAEAEPQRSDLHALFPAKSNVNSSRGNHPYAEIPDAQATAWYRLDLSQSQTPTVALDEWTERANGYPGTSYAARFEPRESVAGDVARAVAYFATVYEPIIDGYRERGFLAVMAADLVAWNAQDPPDAAERARAGWVARLQGTPNPFVLDPALLPRALADYDALPGAVAGAPATAGPLWVNELHYDDGGTDEGEFLEVAGPAGTDLSGWRLVLYNGNGGIVYSERALSGVIPGAAGALGAVAASYPVNGVQNGPDGIALVDPSGAVVQFLSYEGVFEATDGPAAGRLSTSLGPGIEESNGTPEGAALALTGAGRTAADFTWTVGAAASPGALNAGQASAATPAALAPEATALTLGAPAPNPSRGAVRLVLSLSRPAPVRAVVVDALGRTVAVLLDGLASGTTTLSTAERLVPGAYAVRVTSPGGTASRWFTVAGR